MSYNDFFRTKESNDLVQSNGYRFIRRLGEGSYAIVFLTEFINVTGEKMACKVIDTTKAPSDYIRKFLPRELDILRRLNHPHIIHVYAIYKKNFKYMIFMRFAEKGDLLNFISRSGAVIENQARMWVKQISLAIQYLHELEIAHRDLKCENILVTANYNVKLADFGFARTVLSKKGVRMLSVTYCGSTSYCAPEIIKGHPYNPKVADIWSLGVIIFVMLNRAMPFDSSHVKKLYEQQINRKWRFRPGIESVVSVQVKELMENLLEPNTELRYTIGEVLNSEWLFMDHRLLGMTEEESLALVRAKEERRKMEERLASPKNLVIRDNKEGRIRNKNY